MLRKGLMLGAVVTAFVAGLSGCSARASAAESPQRKAVVVATQGILYWTAEAPAQPQEPETYFMLYPVIGLNDVDYHQITESGWRHMKTSGGNAIARLTVARDVKFEELEKALSDIASKGGYKTIQITR